MCVFSTRPSATRRSRSAGAASPAYVCAIGAATAVVALDAPPDELAELGSALGAPRGPARHEPARPGGRRCCRRRCARGAPGRRPAPTSRRPAAGWPQTVADEEPDVIWCAGAEAFLAVPKRLQGRAVVDYVDLPEPQPTRAGARRRPPHRAAHRPRRRGRRQRVRPGARGPGRHPQPDGRALRRPSRPRRDGGQPDRGARRRPLRPHRRRRPRASSPPPATSSRSPTSCSPARSSTRRTRTPPSGSRCTSLPPLRKLLPACRIVFAGPYPDWMPAFAELHGIEVTDAPDLGDGARRALGRDRADPRRVGHDRRGHRRVGSRRPRRRHRAGPSRGWRPATAWTSSWPTTRPSSPPAVRWPRATRSCGRSWPATDGPASRPSSRGR